jgi:lysophospholipase L1-like esterase
MKHILVYGDSLSWGIIPNTRDRLSFEQRWPGALEIALNGTGCACRVIENCLNGRRTVWDDPFKAGRNGAATLSQVIELNAPLALVIIALGTNDFQSTHQNHAWASALGVGTLIDIIRAAPIEPGMPAPEVLVLAPPVIKEPRGEIATKFEGARQRCLGHIEAYRDVSQSKVAHFFDINSATGASMVDGVHLDSDQHATLARALTPAVRQIVGG